jgi:glycosyltransferase involved in cell wall biosynthesis
MSDTIDVSVVIPCYNQAHFLADAIRSVDPGDFCVEIIVVDDGSRDATGEVAASFAGVRRVRQDNQGLAAARNTGLAHARGRFVVFLDADDRLLPGAIACGVQALERHPECGMAYGRCVMMGPDGEPWPTPIQPLVHRDHYAALLRRNIIWTPAAVMFRREALAAIGGFARGFDAAADYDLYLRVTRRWPAHDHAETVAAYRRHPANMSGNASRMLRETLAVMRRHVPADRSLREAWREGCAMWREFYGTHLVEEIRQHVQRGEYGAAARKTLRLARFHPSRVLREIVRKARASAVRLKVDATW